MASTPTIHTFQDAAFSDMVPEVAKIADLKKSSVINARSCVRYIPQGGQLYTQAGPNLCNIIMSDSSRFLDPNSARLSGTFDVSGSTAGVQLSDGITSLINRFRVLLNGQTVEDIQFCGTKTAMEVYASMPYEHYKAQASPLGLFHKYDTNFCDISGGVIGLGICKNQVGARRANVAAAAAAGENFSIPLSYISGFFRQSKAFPLLVAGNLQIIIDWAPSAGLRSGGAGDTVAWKVQDLSLECDMLQMHPLYTEAIYSLVRSPAGSGYILPFTTHMVQQVSVQASSGMKSIAIPNAVKNLRQLSYVIQDQAALSLLTTDKTAFPSWGYVEGYVQVGSHRYPDHPCAGVARAMAQCLDADNELANVVSSPIIDAQNYCNTLTNGVGLNDADAAAFIWSANFDLVKDTYLPLDGIQTLSGLCTVYINNNQTSAGTMTVVAETTRFIKLAQGQITVE